MARLLSPRSLPLARLRFFLPVVFLGELTRRPHAVHSHRDGPLPWSYSTANFAGSCRESSRSGLSPLPHGRRTKPGRIPDSSTRCGNAPDSASSRNPRRINTFTRRAPYSAPAEPISSRPPTTALFSVVTSELPQVTLQLPIGDDVSTSYPCAAWPVLDFHGPHRSRHAATLPASASIRLHRIAFRHAS